MDYRVTLDCGHTHLYRTTVHPSDREHLTCVECGQGQHAAEVVAIASDQCEFHHFTGSSSWVASSTAVRTGDADGAPELADAS
jgi:hypothetical protein